MYSCFIVLALIALSRSDPVSVPGRLCVKSDDEVAKCEAMKNSFQQRRLVPGLECVRGLDVYDCMMKLTEQEADLMTGWFMDFYIAGKYHQLKPFLAEKYNNESDWTDYTKILAVIRKSDESIKSLGDLRGKKSCHSAVASLGGWLLPSAVLNQKGLLPNNSCYSNVPNLADFFSKSCAPEAKEFDPEEKYENLCSLCSGTGDNFCTRKDPYAGYEGSLKCVVDGVGDVAFVLDTTWDDLIKKSPELSDKKNDFELLCLDGSRKSLDEGASCAWGSVPPRGMLVSPNVSDDRISALRDMFFEAQKDLSSFNLFESASGTDIIFVDGTVALIDPGQRSNYRLYVGDDFLNVLENQYPCSVPEATWCTLSDAEFRKCLSMRDGFASRIIKPDLMCIQRNNTENCMSAIKNSKADLIALDGGDIYTGGMKYDLKPIMYEEQGNDNNNYYAVAVVKKSNTNINYENLKGKKSCHTAIGRTAGWNIPIGLLLSNNEIPQPEDCDFPKAVGEFFSASCAPGALDPDYNPRGTNPASLCELCAGVGKDKCSRTDREPYYSYTGAFRCLVEGAGDVAFVKHLTPLDNTEGKNTDDWARNLKKDEFELLCPDGSRKPVDEYLNCNLAKVASHAVATAGSSDSATVDRYLYMLNAGQNFYGRKDLKGFFSIFVSGSGAKDLIFDDATLKLRAIPEAKRDYREYLGSIANVFDGLNEELCKAKST